MNIEQIFGSLSSEARWIGLLFSFKKAMFFSSSNENPDLPQQNSNSSSGSSNSSPAASSTSKSTAPDEKNRIEPSATLMNDAADKKRIWKATDLKIEISDRNNHSINSNGRAKKSKPKNVPGGKEGDLSVLDHSPDNNSSSSSNGNNSQNPDYYSNLLNKIRVRDDEEASVSRMDCSYDAHFLEKDERILQGKNSEKTGTGSDSGEEGSRPKKRRQKGLLSHSYFVRRELGKSTLQSDLNFISREIISQPTRASGSQQPPSSRSFQLSWSTKSRKDIVYLSHLFLDNFTKAYDVFVAEKIEQRPSLIKTQTNQLQQFTTTKKKGTAISFMT